MNWTKILLVFVALICCNINYGQSDSISKPLKPLSIDQWYRKEFSIFDTIKKQGDTLYFMPAEIEPKLVIVDSVSIGSKQRTFNKVMVSSYQVSVRGRSNDVSYYESPESLELFYNNTVSHQYQLPFDQWNPLRSDISYWKKTNTIGLDVNQSSFTNWSAGGYNSISGTIMLSAPPARPA